MSMRRKIMTNIKNKGGSCCSHVPPLLWGKLLSFYVVFQILLKAKPKVHVPQKTLLLTCFSNVISPQSKPSNTSLYRIVANIQNKIAKCKFLQEKIDEKSKLSYN